MSVPTDQSQPNALRPIAVPAAMANPVVRGELPHLGWVEIAKLRIDDRYQRPLQRHNWEAIARIAKAFDWSLFTVVDIAPAGDGLFSVIDGQHRVHAAAMAGIDKVPVRIVAQPLTGQARAFMGINGNVTSITPFHVLRASLAAGEPWAVEADRAITRAGCRLMTSNRTAVERQPGDVYAVQWVRDRIERDGGVSAPALAAMKTALASLKASREGSADVTIWTYTALRGWYGAVEALDDWLEAPGAIRSLAAFLDREGLGALLARAEDRYRQAKRDGKPSAPVYRLLMADLQDRLDEAFQTKAAFIKIGEAG
ncbi:MAG: ParB N-terminal domain-containing protein [Hoeflea sp.]|uniref:ParB N-terminal domain-containing protein n=1 Tax=Hoeflea sp. TaxID=1940281 RepID=UPI003EF7269C